MFKKKYISTLGVPPNKIGTWHGDKSFNPEVDEKVAPFACHCDYFERADPDVCMDYDIGNDWYGPQFFAPS